MHHGTGGTQKGCKRLEVEEGKRCHDLSVRRGRPTHSSPRERVARGGLSWGEPRSQWPSSPQKRPRLKLEFECIFTARRSLLPSTNWALEQPLATKLLCLANSSK
jgi:hypothetical protein